MCNCHPYCRIFENALNIVLFESVQLSNYVCNFRFVLVSCTNSIIDFADTMNDLYRKNLSEGYKVQLKFF